MRYTLTIIFAALLAVNLLACKEPRECGPAELDETWSQLGLPIAAGTVCEVYARGRIAGLELQFADGDYDQLLDAFRSRLLDLGWSGGDAEENPEHTLYTSTFVQGDDQLELVVADLSDQFGNNPVLVSLTRSARLD